IAAGRARGAPAAGVTSPPIAATACSPDDRVHGPPFLAGVLLGVSSSTATTAAGWLALRKPADLLLTMSLVSAVDASLASGRTSATSAMDTVSAPRWA